MNTPENLHHDLIELPTGKKRTDAVGERHELVLLFDCAKSNPNGDPDTGNMPRVQPDSLKGLVTDVCLKRKIRNFFTLYNPHASEPRAWQDSEDRDGYEIFIREGAVLQKLFDPATGTAEAKRIETLAKEIFEKELKQDPKAWDAKKAKKGKGKKADAPRGEAEKPEEGSAPALEGTEAEKAQEVSPAEEAKRRAYQLAVLRTFFDLRAFGGVLSTEGPLKGSFYGQIRGPLQFTFSESLDKVLPLDATITRCAVASVDEEKKQAEADVLHLLRPRQLPIRVCSTCSTTTTPPGDICGWSAWWISSTSRPSATLPRTNCSTSLRFAQEQSRRTASKSFGLLAASFPVA